MNGRPVTAGDVARCLLRNRLFRMNPLATPQDFDPDRFERGVGVRVHYSVPRRPRLRFPQKPTHQP